MKRDIFSIGGGLLLTAMLSFGAQQTWTGEIGDDMCGTNHQAMARGGKHIDPTECTLACVKAGGKYVLVSHGAVFQIANQGLPDLKKRAGRKVRLTGQLGSDHKTITVAEIQAVQ